MMDLHDHDLLLFCVTIMLVPGEKPETPLQAIIWQRFVLMLRHQIFQVFASRQLVNHRDSFRNVVLQFGPRNLLEVVVIQDFNDHGAVTFELFRHTFSDLPHTFKIGFTVVFIEEKTAHNVTAVRFLVEEHVLVCCVHRAYPEE